MGNTPTVDGHAVVLNPRPVGRCAFAAGDTRTWTSLDQIMEGICGDDSTFTLHTKAGHDAELCDVHTDHVQTCPECFPRVGRVEQTEPAEGESYASA